MPVIPTSDQVNVTVSVSATGLATQAFGTGLFVGLSTRLPATDRIRYYSSLSAVAQDFQVTDEEYLGATVWFAQSGAPQLAIARRWTTAVAGALSGALLTSAQQTLSLFTAVTNGGFDISLNGVNKPLTALDFHLQTTLTGVASVLQTALNAALAGTTCVWTGYRFVITSPTTGTGSSVGFAVAPTGGGAPVAVGSLLGLLSSSGGYSGTGSAAEATSDVSLNAILNISSQWYGFTLSNDSTAAEKLAAGTWALSNNKAYLHTETVVGAKASGDTTSNMYLFSQLTSPSTNPGMTISLFSGMSNYMTVGAWCASLAQTDFTQANSVRIMNGTQILGVTADQITPTELAYLRAKNGGAYCAVGAVGSSATPMVLDGKAGSGRFADEIFGLAWLQNIVQVDTFNFLRSVTTKIPQTDEGMVSLLGVVERSCAKGVNNGLLAPGTWNGNQLKTTSGDVINKGDFLKVGFRVVADSMQTQDAAARAARVAPPIYVAAKGAGAIQTANIAINFDR